MVTLGAIIIVIALAVALMLFAEWRRKKRPYETLGEFNKRNKQT